LLYGNGVFETPVPVSILLSGSPVPFQTTVTIPAGSSSVDVTLPAISKAAAETITAAANGFATGDATIAVVSTTPTGGDALGLSAPNVGVGLTEACIYLMNNKSVAASPASQTVYIYSSNPDVISAKQTSVTLSAGQASVLITLDYTGVGSSTITLVSPGLATAQVQTTVLPAVTPSIEYSGPSTLREGETYPFTISFVVGTTPIDMNGTVNVFTQDINTDKTAYSVLDGVVFGMISGQSSGSSSMTLASSNMAGLVIPLTVVVVPLLTLQTYQVSVESSSTPLAGVPVSFTYGNTTTAVSTSSSGLAVFQAVNSTSTGVSVPLTATVSGVTYYFQGWSNGVTSSRVNLFSSVKLTANYEIVQKINYTATIKLTSGGSVPNATAVLTINKVNSTLSSTKGVISFTELSNTKGSLKFPQAITISNNERYYLISVDNGTSPVISLTSSNITAVYSLQYFIAVFTAHGSVAGSGWYNSGTAARIDLNETSVSTGLLTYIRFVGWQGGATVSQGPVTQIIVSGPEIVNAVWVQDNTFLYATFGGVAIAAGVIGFILLRRYSQTPKVGSEGLESDGEEASENTPDTL
jgi:hypothetical protein